MRRLKLILLFRSVPSDDIKLRELLERFGLIERFTPYVAGGRGALRGAALLPALSRGYQWFGELSSGKVASTRQIAVREGLSHSYVRHVVPLGLLAPKVMEAICAGQQSVTISAERLKDHARHPNRMGRAAASSFESKTLLRIRPDWASAWEFLTKSH